MGAYASNLRGDAGNLVGEFSHPGKDDWITAHAAASGLTVVEVERLWQRFQQLGVNDEGILTTDVLQKPPAADDIFVRNILGNMMTEESTITFQTFLGAMKWAENVNMMEKIRAIFHLLNNGEPLTRQLLEKVLSRVYPDDSSPSDQAASPDEAEPSEAVQRITNVFFQQMDTSNQGFIDEEQFVSWVKTLPAETVSSILSFSIMPPDITQDSGPVSPQIDMRPSSVDTIAHQVPTDPVLQDVAGPVSKRDWHLVANKLGHTSEDIEKFETDHPNNKTEQVMAMLKAWRSREGSQAYVETLEHALRDSNMNDIALRLYP